MLSDESIDEVRPFYQFLPITTEFMVITPTKITTSNTIRIYTLSTRRGYTLTEETAFTFDDTASSTPIRPYLQPVYSNFESPWSEWIETIEPINRRNFPLLFPRTFPPKHQYHKAYDVEAKTIIAFLKVKKQFKSYSLTVFDHLRGQPVIRFELLESKGIVHDNIDLLLGNSMFF
ncbi:MAG: hypothetical protein EOP45_19380 [Sphingobacteriaceae bacterium]|nr:MAG: hypothetical protein EOP45_19380 [Sphingobacteriaceae bacterium]